LPGKDLSVRPTGFRACGIYPFNPKAVPSKAYIPNSLYAAHDVTESPKECMTAVTDTAINCKEHSSNGTEATCENNVLTEPSSSLSAKDSQVMATSPELARDTTCLVMMCLWRKRA